MYARIRHSVFYVETPELIAPETALMETCHRIRRKAYRYQIRQLGRLLPGLQQVPVGTGDHRQLPPVHIDQFPEVVAVALVFIGLGQLLVGGIDQSRHLDLRFQGVDLILLHRAALLSNGWIS